MIAHITNQDIGRWVVFTPTGQVGRIKSFNDRYVFVVYSCNDRWEKYMNYTGEATLARDLEWDLTKGEEIVCPQCHLSWLSAVKLNNAELICRNCKKTFFVGIIVSSKTT